MESRDPGFNYNYPEEVQEIGKLNIEGNIVPIEWFKVITYDNGKPDTNAILILSDIVYWYRPSVIRDESTGSFIGYKKKFHEDILRRSYSDYESLFGLSKKQIRDCLIRLEELGLIRREFRTIETGIGAQNNVMYIRIFPKVLLELTYERSPHNLKVTTSFSKNNKVLPYKEIPNNLEGNIILKKTYTSSKNTTKSTPIVSPIEKLSSTREQERESKSFEMMKIWQEIVLNNSKELHMNEERELKLAKVFKEHLKGDITKWVDLCKNVTRSKFLMGEARNSPFVATLDWVCEGYNALKILEGSYGIGDREQASLTSSESAEYSVLATKIEESEENEATKDLKLWILRKLGLIVFRTWFSEVSGAYEHNQFTLIAPTSFAAEQIEKRFKSHLLRFVKEKLGHINLRIEGKGLREI